MKLYFKPMPWLTFIVAICLGILISLGTWQYQRLQWKTALLAEVEAAATAVPFTSLVEIQDALKAGEPVDFRRYAFAIETNVERLYMVYDSAGRRFAWRPYVQVSDGTKRSVYLASQAVDDPKREDILTSPKDLLIDYSAGYVRLAYADVGWLDEFVRPKANLSDNRWFHFNQNDLWRAADNMKIYLDHQEVVDVAKLPPKRPDIRNNHLDYMLTWYSFAVILLIIYLILHKRAGRLKFS